MVAKKVDPRAKIKKVAEADAKKRKEANAAAEAVAVENQVQAVQAKQAEAAGEMKEKIKDWEDPQNKPRLEVHTPAFMTPDPTYIPDYIDLPDGTTRRIKEPGYRYRWTRYVGKPDRVPFAKLKGWRPIFYTDKFAGTGWFEKTVEGWVVNGDCILMEISDSGFERLQKEKNRLYGIQTRATETGFHNEGAKAGVRTFREDRDRGVTEYA